MNLKIKSDRILAELETLASFSVTEAPAVTRIVFTPVDLQARTWLKERCEAAGLTVREDAVGNTFARWIGTDPALPAVASGSHIDAIPHSGRYDGTVGVLGALEAIRALQDAGFQPATFHRADSFHLGGTYALRLGLPRQSPALRHAGPCARGIFARRGWSGAR